ncbi:unnamed protein product [Lymnaea stagnalis]|uniref:Death domain-containing protein n=1 Tax=Lymnaea stagnalis TaxID=6523 RepID=A0AAV2HUQ4_LYMST
MPRQNEGVDVKVRLVGEEEGEELTLYEHWPVKQFLKIARFMLPKHERERRYQVIILYDNDRREVIQNEEEEFGDRIVSCKELIVEPIGGASNETQDCANSNLKDAKKPYLWFYQLPKAIQCKVIKYRDVALIALCLGELKVNLMLRLGFEHGTIEHAIENAKGQETNWYTSLLIKWIRRETDQATYEALLEEMRKIEDVHHGAYDWVKIKRIILDQ